MIVLDTHAWVWWNARPEGLSKRARPADRMIVATALDAEAPLVTKDRRIRDARVLEAIW